MAWQRLGRSPATLGPFLVIAQRISRQKIAFSNSRLPLNEERRTARTKFAAM